MRNEHYVLFCKYYNLCCDIFMLLFSKNECHLKLSNVVGYVVIFVFFFKNEQDLKLRNVVGVENPVRGYLLSLLRPTWDQLNETHFHTNMRSTTENNNNKNNNNKNNNNWLTFVRAATNPTISSEKKKNVKKKYLILKCFPKTIILKKRRKGEPVVDCLSGCE